ncbi:hypothetical protein FHX42_000324 [Saccharopolyspora lacisalsi]|uniref:Uncharacterized protein n=1 Tax=Halosaccharopolyspora lacisalsi TaxID=1000566 RepID=A0A839DUN9_9PSEU|nr:hypothetical protein [Halosaccharopolyspora lacisalsi]MBA8822995.1 hypothetical protein [Halosaccharopolyspora lacisalsi]
MLIDAHTQVLATLTVFGAALLVMAAIVARGHLRGSTGRHSGPDTVTVAHIRDTLAAEVTRGFITRHQRRALRTASGPGVPEDYVGRHRLPESHPDHGIPLDLPGKNPCRPGDNWIPCGQVTAKFPW